MDKAWYRYIGYYVEKSEKNTIGDQNILNC